MASSYLLKWILRLDQIQVLFLFCLLSLPYKCYCVWLSLFVMLVVIVDNSLNALGVAKWWYSSFLYLLIIVGSLGEKWLLKLSGEKSFFIVFTVHGFYSLSCLQVTVKVCLIHVMIYNLLRHQIVIALITVLFGSEPVRLLNELVSSLASILKNGFVSILWHFTEKFIP